MISQIINSVVEYYYFFCKSLTRFDFTGDKIGRFCLAIKSANKNLSSAVQKSADFIIQHGTRSILDDKIRQLSGYQSPR